MSAAKETPLAKSTVGTHGGQVAYLGAGCYWGTEKYYVKNFQQLHPNSILAAEVGFMGGKGDNPSYKQVCSGATGHVEIVALEFDPKKTTLRDVYDFFFTFHDPTTPGRQGPDKGTQYESVIFYVDDDQKAVAEASKKWVNSLLASKQLKFSSRAFDGKEVTTGILPAAKFFPAHEEHQKYLEKNPRGYCSHAIRFVKAEQPKL